MHLCHEHEARYHRPQSAEVWLWLVNDYSRRKVLHLSVTHQHQEANRFTSPKSWLYSSVHKWQQMQQNDRHTRWCTWASCPCCQGSDPPLGQCTLATETNYRSVRPSCCTDSYNVWWMQAVVEPHSPHPTTAAAVCIHSRVPPAVAMPVYTAEW